MPCVIFMRFYPDYNCFFIIQYSIGSFISIDKVMMIIGIFFVSFKYKNYVIVWQHKSGDT